MNWMRRKPSPERARERVRERGLAHSGYVLEQHVAPGQQRGQRQAHDLVLAVEDALDLGDQPIEQLERRRRFVGRYGGVGHRFQGPLLVDSTVRSVRNRVDFPGDPRRSARGRDPTVTGRNPPSHGAPGGAKR